MTRRRRIIALLMVAGLGVSCSARGGGAGSTNVRAGVIKPLAGHTAAPAVRSWTPWPQALYDAQHSGASPAVGPRTGHLRWTRRLEGNITPGPVIAADGTIYVASNAGVLHALDPVTGKDRWVVDEHGSYGADQSTSAAVLPSSMVLWPGPNGNLVALTTDGRVSWRLHLGGQVTSPAVRADGEVVVGNDAGLLLRLHPTAKGPGEQWRVELGEQSYGSPVFSTDGATAYQSVVSGVFAVAAGKVLWHSTAPKETVEVSPAVAPDGTVVIGSNDHHEYGLDPRDGSVRWTHQLGFTTYSSPGVTRDGISYLGDHGNKITGLDAATGKVAFAFQGSAKDNGPGGIGIWTSVLVDAHHSVYAGTRQGLVYGADRSGHLLWTVEAGATVDSYPALTRDGALVIGTTDGRLLAISDG
ncbi:MAG: PQQ-binding-like beta-propeller repeat protein [Marmoricola sp.]